MHRDGSVAYLRSPDLRSFSRAVALGPGATLTILTRGDHLAAVQGLADSAGLLFDEGDWFLSSSGHVPPNRLQLRLLTDQIAAGLPYADAGIGRDRDGRVSCVRKLKRGFQRALFVDFEPYWPYLALVRADGADAVAVANAFDGQSEDPVDAVGRGWWVAGSESDGCTWTTLTFFVPATNADAVESRLVAAGLGRLHEDDVPAFLHS